MAPLLSLLVDTAIGMTPQEAIKSQAGCHAVTFQYGAHERMDPSFPGGENKRSEAIEWVSIEVDEPDHIQLQHVLVSGPAMIRHWTQDWTFEGRETMAYAGNDTWQLGVLSSDQASGRWLQRVDNVDGAPRYACSARWEIGVGSASWTCTVDAPLPRRERHLQEEYDILRRENTHRIERDGWSHVQRNTKVRLDGRIRVDRALERGHNTYRRIDDARCAAAIDWWPTRREAWRGIQLAWVEALAPYSVVLVEESRSGIPLWVRLFLVARRSSGKEQPLSDAHQRAAMLLERHVHNGGPTPAERSD
ncbi:MAG: DUF6607 family protein [Myxococcota bacterium]|nr:DUF6607 family protein [Myxococcota bacterium]